MKGAAILLFLSLTALSVGGGSAAADASFIQDSCRDCGYPSFCAATLTPYAAVIKGRPRYLVGVSVYVALRYAQFSSSFLHSHPAVQSSDGALRDCVETVDSGLNMLKKSSAELRLLGQPGTSGFLWRRSNVQTWLSAAMSDTTTCIEGLTASSVDQKVKTDITRHVLILKRRTSVALFFVNRM